MDKIVEIPTAKIQVGQNALRMETEDEDIDALAASIGRVGILVPLLVHCEGDQYHLIAGHRRYVAAVRIGLEKVPCLVRDTQGAKSSEMAFAENIFRRDLTPVEIAAGVKDVIDRGNMTGTEIARALGRSETWVCRMLAVLTWPGDVLEAVHAGWLSLAAASNLALINDDTYRDFLLRNAEQSGATARVTAAWLQAWRSLAPPEQALKTEPEPAGSRASPAVPQAPCLACGEVYRTDELSHVPICAGCIRAIRNAALPSG